MSTNLSQTDQVKIARWMLEAFVDSKVILSDDLDILDSFRFPNLGNTNTIGNTMVTTGIASILGILCAARYNSYIALGASTIPFLLIYAFKGYSLYRIANIKEKTRKLMKTFQKSFMLDIKVSSYCKYRQKKLHSMNSDTVLLIRENDVDFYAKYKQNLTIIIIYIQDSLKAITDEIPSLSIYYSSITNFDVQKLCEYEISLGDYEEAIKKLHDLYCLVTSAFLTSAGIAIKLFISDNNVYRYIDGILPLLYKKINALVDESGEDFKNFKTSIKRNICRREESEDANTLIAQLASLGVHSKLVLDISTALAKSNKDNMDDITNAVTIIRSELTCATECLEALEDLVVKKKRINNVANAANSDTESYHSALVQTDDLDEAEETEFAASGELCESSYSIDRTFGEETYDEDIHEQKKMKTIRNAVVRELKDKLGLTKGITTEEPPPPPPFDILSVTVPAHIRTADANNAISLSEAVSAIARHMERTEEVFEDIDEL